MFSFSCNRFDKDCSDNCRIVRVLFFLFPAASVRGKVALRMPMVVVAVAASNPVFKVVPSSLKTASASRPQSLAIS